MDFLLHIPFWLHCYLGRFSYISRAVFNLIRGLSLTHPMPISFLSGEFLLHIPCWLHYYFRSFSYTSPAEVIFIVGVSLTRPVLALLLLWGVSLTNPMLASFYTPGSFSCTSSAGLIFGEFCLTHPMLTLFLSGRFLLHVPCWHYIYVRSFSHTSHTGFFFFSFYPGSFSYTSRAGFTFLWGVSLTHPVLASFLSGEFLLHIPCWL